MGCGGHSGGHKREERLEGGLGNSPGDAQVSREIHTQNQVDRSK